MPKFIGREPAVFFATLVALLQALALLFVRDVEVQGYVNASLLMLGGLLTALVLHNIDGVLPALIGLVKSVFALVIALDLHVDQGTQVAVLAIISAAAAFFTRTQVRAPVDPPIVIDAVRRRGITRE